jgi:hypothetical protein
MTNQPNSQNSYTSSSGTSSTFPFIDIIIARDPTPDDVNYPVQKKWLNSDTQFLWMLESFTTVGGKLQAQWLKIGSNANTLEGNSGGIVPADLTGNIHVVGDGTSVNVVGNPSTHTLNITAASAVATSYTEDSGSATPLANVLQIRGGTGISTIGSSNIVTIDATGAVATDYVANTGSAVPSSNSLSVLGGTGIATTGSGHTLTIATAGDVPVSFVEGTGTATPSLGVINILGGPGITTSGSLNTVTIDTVSSIPTSFTEDTGTASATAGVLKIVGGPGVVTAGSGNTVTISAGGITATSFVEDSGTATPALDILNVVGGASIVTSGSGNTVTIASNNETQGTATYNVDGTIAIYQNIGYQNSGLLQLQVVGNTRGQETFLAISSNPDSITNGSSLTIVSDNYDLGIPNLTNFRVVCSSTGTPNSIYLLSDLGNRNGSPITVSALWRSARLPASSIEVLTWFPAVPGTIITNLQQNPFNCALGQMVNQVYATDGGTYLTVTTVTPADDTIPQITEGVPIFSAAITPRNANNILVVTATSNFFVAAAVSSGCVLSLFRDAIADAVSMGYMSGTGTVQRTSCSYSVVAGSTSATTFSVRAGCQVASSPLYINGNNSSRVGAGTLFSTILIQEFKPIQVGY